MGTIRSPELEAKILLTSLTCYTELTYSSETFGIRCYITFASLFLRPRGRKSKSYNKTLNAVLSVLPAVTAGGYSPHLRLTNEERLRNTPIFNYHLDSGGLYIVRECCAARNHPLISRGTAESSLSDTKYCQAETYNDGAIECGLVHPTSCTSWRPFSLNRLALVIIETTLNSLFNA